MKKINMLYRDPKEPGGDNEAGQEGAGTATQENGGGENGGETAGDGAAEGGE